MQGTVNSERFIIGKEKKASSVDPDSIIGSDRFRVSWRDALQDMAFVDFVQEKLPSSLDDKSGFNRSTEFTDDPHGFLNFNYDAITSLGLSMCMAGDNTTFFNGYDIYQQFLQLDFEGASGQIRILSESGSRDYKTIAFVVWNVRILGENAEGYSIIEYVPSYHYQNGRWTEILGNGFEFADGTKDIPESLPPLAFNYNYIGKPSRIVSYILMGMVMTAALASAVWTLYHKHSHVVDSAQPLFLIAISLGSFFMAVTILPLGFEETVVSNIQGLDAACMAVPWLYFLGASIAISGLLAKTKAVHQVRQRL